MEKKNVTKKILAALILVAVMTCLMSVMASCASLPYTTRISYHDLGLGRVKINIRAVGLTQKNAPYLNSFIISGVSYPRSSINIIDKYSGTYGGYVVISAATFKSKSVTLTVKARYSYTDRKKRKRYTNKLATFKFKVHLGAGYIIDITR